ncbi:MAG TPA: hypothetical protein VHG91_17300 [Longimicrobium sp.]|nr:hypothetical protein [Longimicrobium sp.]
MTTLRALTISALLPVLLLPGCGGWKPAFEQDVAVRQYLPAPADTTWRDQAPVRTPLKVGPDSLPVTVEWTPTRREAHRAISRISVAFPEHRSSDSLSAKIQGGPINHGTRDAILEGLTLLVQWNRGDDLSTSIVHLTSDGTARLD